MDFSQEQRFEVVRLFLVIHLPVAMVLIYNLNLYLQKQKVGLVNDDTLFMIPKRTEQDDFTALNSIECTCVALVFQHEHDKLMKINLNCLFIMISLNGIVKNGLLIMTIQIPCDVLMNIN